MKKILIVTLIVVAALAGLATAAFAQGEARPVSDLAKGRGRGPGQIGGPLGDYVHAAIATALDLTADELNARLAEGESLYDIAVAQGLAVDEIAALRKNAHAAAIAAALQDGVITQAQADWMKARQADAPKFGSLLHEYHVDALAAALKITAAEVEARLSAGQSPYDIAAAKGIASDQISTVLTNARTATIDAALKDGIITQAQADAMKSNAGGPGFGHMDGGPFGEGPHGHGPMGGGRGPRGGWNVQP